MCPMQDMLGDLFTKPLQGALYARMREKILNLSGSTHTAMHSSVLGKAKSNEGINVNEKTNDKWKENEKKTSREKRYMGLSQNLEGLSKNDKNFQKSDLK